MPKVVRRVAEVPVELPKPAGRAQLAALPYVMLAGRVHVCLVTSRETRRWVIPKGWPERKVAPHLQAAAEAMEEAGLAGIISPAAIGLYTYTKRMPRSSDVSCRVTVYPMLVVSQALDWPERKQRELAWMPASEAATKVDEPELAALIARSNDMHLRTD